MKPKRIIRRPDACNKLACGRTKFRDDYEYYDADDPYVPGTKIPRLKALSLGPRNVGFIESEIDALIDALAALRESAAPDDDDGRAPRRVPPLRPEIAD